MESRPNIAWLDALATLDRPEPKINRALCRLLSFNTDTTPSVPLPPPSEDPTHYKKIGAGSCGAVFASKLTSPTVAIKLSKSEDNTALLNDYLHHHAIACQFEKFQLTSVFIPGLYELIDRSGFDLISRYPGLQRAARAACDLPASALTSQRIPPLSRSTQALLVAKYCSHDAGLSTWVLADPASQDCLVRVYLGSTSGRTNQRMFSLRNFKLHLNHMVDLRLDYYDIARRMAIALALMHWGAETDARDVEFVLGSNPPHTSEGEPVNHRTTVLWVLDFNQVRDITMDEEGVALAVEAARVNDPYLPRPLRESQVEQSLWEQFVTMYLGASGQIFRVSEYAEDDMVWTLPGLFIQGLVTNEEKRQHAQSTVFQKYYYKS